MSGASLLEQLSRHECWEAFYEYKTSLAFPKAFAAELKDFIDRRAYLPVTEAICRGEPFPLPRKSVISKVSTGRKRVVYTYPRAENTVLKLLTWLMLRRYDGCFDPALWSFRPGRSAKDAVRRLLAWPGTRGSWVYKADVADYFNSVPVERLLPALAKITAEDPALFAFLRRLLEEPRVLENGREVTEAKGIMAGTPLSAFYANLYLADLDRAFAGRGIPYARYSDDVILFAPDPAAAKANAAFLQGFLAGKGLTLNPDKAALSSPEEGWVFLGFRVQGGRVDIAPATVEKLKGKMRRKARALLSWRQRNGVSGEKAAAAFIRVFNRKLLENAGDSELTWSRWFFPVINTSESLREIDRYAQDCIRYIISGKRTKGRFNVRYEDLKALGYRSLVNAYYDFRGTERSPGPAPADTKQ